MSSRFEVISLFLEWSCLGSLDLLPKLLRALVNWSRGGDDDQPVLLLAKLF